MSREYVAIVSHWWVMKPLHMSWDLQYNVVDFTGMREENGSFQRRACGWKSHTPFHVSIPRLDLGRMSTFPCLRRPHIMTKVAFVVTPRASHPLRVYDVLCRESIVFAYSWAPCLAQP